MFGFDCATENTRVDRGSRRRPSARSNWLEDFRRGAFRVLKASALVGALLAQALPSHAQSGQGDAIYYETDWIKRLRPNWDVEPLDENLLGDRIDLQTGSLSFEHTDVSLPGNSHLEVAVRRSKEMGEGYAYEFGDWRLLFPVIKTNIPESQWNTTGGRWGKNRCTQPLGNAIPVAFYGAVLGWGTQPIPASKHSNGVVMEIPGQGAQQVLDNANPAGTSFPSTATKTSTDGWYFTCISNIDGAGTEGFYAHAPNGDRYRFDKIVSRRGVRRFEVWADLETPGTVSAIVTHDESTSYDMLAASEVTDADGNWVRYEYNTEGRLTRIHANDGRRIDITYSLGIRTTQVVANPGAADQRVWTYEYAGDFITLYDSDSDRHGPRQSRQDQLIVLKRVTRPDGRSWVFNLVGMYAEGVPGLSILFDTNHLCTQFDQTVSVTHPDGATGAFTLKEVTRELALGGPFDGTPCPQSAFGAAAPYRVDTMAVTGKTLTIPGAPMAEWTYEYPLTPVNGQNVTTVHRPDASKKVYFHRQPYVAGQAQPSRLWEEQTFPSATDQTPIEVRKYEYSGESPAGSTYVSDMALTATVRYHESLIRIERGSDWYETRLFYHNDRTQSNFDFGNPHRIERHSGVSPETRVTEITYEHQTANWILGLRKSLTRDGKEFELHSYDPANGHRLWLNKFGVRAATFAYHTSATEPNAVGQLRTFTDAVNNVTTLRNYRRGVPQTVLLPDATTFSRVVNDNGWVTSEANQRNYTTAYEYDGVGRLTKITPPSGDGAVAVTNIAYTYPNGSLVQTITQGSARTTNTFDGRLRPYLQKREDTSALGGVSFVRREFDAFNRTLYESFPAATDVAAAGVRTTYDALGRVVETRQTVAPFAVTTTEYLSGNRVKVTDPRLNVTTTTQSGYGDPDDGGPTLIDAPIGTDTTITYDIWGNKDIETRGTAVTNYDYDASLRPSQVTDPDGYITQTFYDAADRPIVERVQIQGTAHRRTRTDYDAMGRPQKVIRAWRGADDGSGSTLDCAQMRASYNPATGYLQQCYQLASYTPTGELDTVTDANGNLTKYEYDQLDRRTRTYFPTKTQAGTWSTTDYEHVVYDALGHPDTKRTRANQTIDYTHDALGRLRDRLVPNAPQHTANGRTVSHSYTYDAADRRLTAVHDGVTLSFDYDEIGRIEWQRHNGARQVSYQFDATNNLTRLTYPDGWAVDYAYDELNRVKDAIDNNGATPRTLAHVDYDPLSRRSRLAYANGATANYTFSGRGDLQCHAWNFAGAAPSDCATGAPEIRWSRTYNGARQVLDESVSDAAYRWGPQLANVSYVPNGLNQYTSVGGVAVVHDGNGNLTADHRGRGYQYDAENVLRSVAGVASYRYYADGARSTKTVGSASSQFYYMGDQEIAEYNGATLKRRYVRVPESVDEPILMIDYTLSGACTLTSYAVCERWTHQNRQRSVVAVTSASGAVVEQFRYSPYGQAGAEGPAGFPFRFTGQKLDAETGLYYYKARYYDPDTGRFLQTDPVGHEDDLNLYAYVRNDPLNGVDPSGENCRPLDVGIGVTCDFVQHEIEYVDYSGHSNPHQLQTGSRPSLQSNGPGAGEDESDEIIVLAQNQPRRGGPSGRPYTPAQRLRIDLHNRAVEEVRRYDPGYAEMRDPNSVPTPEATARVIVYGRSLRRVSEYFEARGIGIHPHAIQRIVQREARGVTPQAALNAYNRGRIFHDPATGNYIRRDAQTGVYVVVTSPTGGQIQSVVEGNIRPRWNPIPYR